MSYAAQGDLASELLGMVSSAGSAAARVIEDPHLPEVTCHILRLNAIEKGQKPGPKCKKIPKATAVGRGIGLRYATGPLRTFVAVRERPWIVPVVVGGLLGGVFLLGYVAGAASKRRRG